MVCQLRACFHKHFQTACGCNVSQCCFKINCNTCIKAALLRCLKIGGGHALAPVKDYQLAAFSDVVWQQSYSKVRVVSQHGAGASDDGISTAAERMRDHQGSLGGERLLSLRRQHGAVAVDGLFHGDEGQALCDALFEGGDQPFDLPCIACQKIDEQASAAQMVGTSACDFWIGIGGADDHVFGWRCENCFGAGARAAVVVAGFEGDDDGVDEIGFTGCTGLLNGQGFGVELPCPVVACGCNDVAETV